MRLKCRGNDEGVTHTPKGVLARKGEQKGKSKLNLEQLSRHTKREMGGVM